MLKVRTGIGIRFTLSLCLIHLWVPHNNYTAREYTGLMALLIVGLLYFQKINNVLVHLKVSSSFICAVIIEFSSFYGCVTFHCVYISYFLYSSIQQ